ncbi:MAG: DUF3180 domain-containing protein [Propionicimonas sp.]|uniref:DUF3180 domain-containing protein n=1 Tax=Propionicimonas sp. TaxID=1955623 RepID=UPI003D0D56D4
MPERPEPTGTVTPIGWQSVAVAFVVGAGLGWSLFTALDRFTGDTPQLPVVVAGVIALMAGAVAVQAWRTHRLVQVQRHPIAPRRAVALLVLGRTSLVGGTALAGAYAAISVYLALRLPLNLPTERLFGSVVAMVASAALGVAGAFLERACRIPRHPDEDATPPAHPGTDDAAD